MRPTTVRYRQIRDVCILDLEGPLRLGQGEDLLGQIQEGLLRDGLFKVVLNFAEVPWVEDGPLGMLLGLCAAIHQRDGSVRVIHARPKIASFMEITQTEGLLFEFCEDELEALDSLK